MNDPFPTTFEASRRLLEQIAQRLGKKRDELKPWVDYDPIAVDEQAYHMSRGQSGVRWAGD